VCTTETISDLAIAAGKAALQNAGIEASELDYIICSTIRGDYITPSLACVVQNAIGANCPAFDLNAACSGFLYALDCAAGYFARGRAKKVLIIAAEVMSKMVNWQDRATCVLFGDGAGAVVLGEGDGLLSIKLSASGNTDFLRIPHVSGNSPFSNGQHEEPFLHMQGQDVYKFAVTSMAHDLAEVIEDAGLQQSDVDFVLPHQANMRIIDSAKKKLKIAPEKYYTNIETCGNTSCAGVAMLLDELNRKNLFQPGNILALAAFGSGLTTGACVIRW
jgi:3-oxoacyl-[acyl-carrier-protein] synthase-3